MQKKSKSAKQNASVEPLLKHLESAWKHANKAAKAGRASYAAAKSAVGATANPKLKAQAEAIKRATFELSAALAKAESAAKAVYDLARLEFAPETQSRCASETELQHRSGATISTGDSETEKTRRTGTPVQVDFEGKAKRQVCNRKINPAPVQMFTAPQVLQFGVKANPFMPLPEGCTARLELFQEETRTAAQIEADTQRAAERLTVSFL